MLLPVFVAILIGGCGQSGAPSAPAVPAVAGPEASSGDPASPPAGAANPAAEPAVESAPSVAPVQRVARKLDTAEVDRGAAVYRAHCANCHGRQGEATTGWRTPGADGKYPPPPLDDSAHAWHHSSETLEKMIRVGGSGMPAWDGRLTDQQIRDVVAWIKSLWSDEIYDIWYKEIEHPSQPG